MAVTIWAGNYSFGAHTLHRPASLDDVREIVAAAPKLRVLGTRHSFSGIADADEILTLEGLPADVVVDHAASTVSAGAGITYGELATALNAEGRALHNMASLPHISIGGAVSTASHGSGDGNGNLATAVAALEMVTSDGALLTASRGDADFNGLVVGLGALGVLTRVTLDIEPTFDVRQRVFESLAWSALFEHFDEITASGYSVSVFTQWGETVDQVWVKSRVTDDPADEDVGPDLFGAIGATIERHPILGNDPSNCTPQLGVPGRWSDRLPHFRMGFTPSNGEELQSEYLVPRRHAVSAIEAVLSLRAVVSPVLLVSEIRTVASDDLWMSPQHGRDTVGIHFTWKREQDAVERVLVDVEAALAPFESRPHWGKLFLADAASIAPLYERHTDFTRLCERLDSRGAFTNAWMRSRVLG